MTKLEKMDLILDVRLAVKKIGKPTLKQNEGAKFCIKLMLAIDVRQKARNLEFDIISLRKENLRIGDTKNANAKVKNIKHKQQLVMLFEIRKFHQLLTASVL